MLRKVFKYDFRILSRNVLPLVIAIPAIGLLSGGVTLLTYVLGEKLDFEQFGFLLGLSMFSVLLIGALWVAAAIAGILVLLRYYKSVFTDEGYLTMAMPIRTDALLLGKMFAGGLWLIIIAAACGIAFFFASVVPDMIYFETLESLPLYDVEAPYFLDTLLPLWLGGAMIAIFEWVGIYSAVTLGGTLTGRHKFALALLFAFLLLFVQGVAALIALFVVPVEITTWQMSGILSALAAVGAVALYFLSRYMLHSHYNVE